MNTCGIGVVLQASGDGQALVEILRDEACKHCAGADVCNALGSRGNLRLTADNLLAARVGQRVEVAQVRFVGMQAALLAYLLPTVMFVTAVVLSVKLAHLPVWASLLIGLGALVAAWWIARAFDRRVRQRPEYRFRIIRVIAEPGRSGGEARTGNRP